MGKNRVRQAVVHRVPAPDGFLSGGVNELYFRHIQRRLSEQGLNLQQKLDVLDQLVAQLHTRPQEF